MCSARLNFFFFLLTFTTNLPVVWWNKCIDYTTLKMLEIPGAFYVMFCGLMVSNTQHTWIVGFFGSVVFSILLTYLLMKITQTFKSMKLISELNEKAVLITGCDTGFGHMLAQRLDKLGFKVYACCLQPEGDGAKVLQANAINDLKIIKMDVTKPEDVDSAKSFVEQDLGQTKLWSVMNNAGIMEVGDTELCPMDRYERILNVNTLGPLRVTQAFLPLLRAAGEGRVVFVSSIAGRLSVAGFSAYCMSKSAVITIADALRQEMTRWNISVHTIEPMANRTKLMETSALISSANQGWEDTPEIVRKSYPEDYMNDFNERLKELDYMKKPAEKVDEVLDAMVHAIADVSPKVTYVPGLATEFLLHTLMMLPSKLLDKLIWSKFIRSCCKITN